MSDEQRPVAIGEVLREQLAGIVGARWDSTSTPAEEEAGPTCARCRDVGFLRRDVPADHAEFGKLLPCDCGVAQARRVRRVWASAGVPKRLADARFASYPASAQTAPIAELIRAVWLDDGPSWLLLSGPTGRGKSGLAVSALRELIGRGQSGLFVPAPNLLDRIRQSWDETLGVKEHEVVAAVRDVDVLVIDDLGKEQATDWVKTRLFVLLNDRYNAERRTIVTTNLSDRELAQRVGEPVMSRIEDAAGGVYVLRLDGPNLRAR
jgi:DNA replication protein DnaC